MGTSGIVISRARELLLSLYRGEETYKRRN
jgi:hypothetical protein